MGDKNTFMSCKPCGYRSAFKREQVKHFSIKGLEPSTFLFREVDPLGIPIQQVEHLRKRIKAGGHQYFYLDGWTP